MLRRTMVTVAPLVAFLGGMGVVLAQTTPGPTNPTPPNPQAKPGATMVINPTEEECRIGWNQTLKWTKEQFEQFCAQMKASK